MPTSMMRSLLIGAVLAAAPVVVVAAPPQAAREVVKAAATPSAPDSLRKLRRLASLTSGKFIDVLLIICLTIRVYLSDVGRPMLVGKTVRGITWPRQADEVLNADWPHVGIHCGP